MKPLLLYYQHLYQTSNLIEGRLLLVDVESIKLKNTYIATSGTASNQTFEALSSRGRGSIPPINLVGLDNYTVETSPIYMPTIKGVAGNFYKIDPHEVLIEGKTRGDFGVHFDANVPGSAGCVVLRTKVGWEALQEDFKNLASQGIKKIPLMVSYSR